MLCRGCKCHKFAVLLGLENRLHLRVARRPIHLLFCDVLRYMRVSSLFARHVAVGRGGGSIAGLLHRF